MRVKPAPADGCPVDPADTHAAAPECSRNPHRLDREPQRIAYDLWCLQENRRIARQPLASLDGLIHTLRARNPWLEASDIERGTALFLAWTLTEVTRSCAARHRYVFEVPRLRSRTGVGCAPCPATDPSPVSNDCTVRGFARYNDQNDRTPDPGDSNATRGLSAPEKQKQRPQN